MKKYLILKLGEANYNAIRPVLLFLLLVIIPCAIFAAFDYPVLNYFIDNPKFLWGSFFVLFSLFSGWAEAILFHKYSQINIQLDINPHILLNITRLFVWLPMVFLIDFQSAGALVLMFPFLHDGKFYAHRNTLNGLIYDNRWWSNHSDSSSAIIDLNVIARTALFLIGFAIFLFKF